MLFSFTLLADDAKKHRKVLFRMAGVWSGTGENVSVNSSNKQFPSKSEQKSLGKPIFNEKALFRRVNYRIIIPDQEDRIFDSFVISFWLDFKQKYRSVTFDSRGVVYQKDFTMDDDGNCKVYTLVDDKFVESGQSKVTQVLFKGSSEYQARGFLRKATFEFKRVPEVKFVDPKVEFDPAVKKVLDTFPGKYPLTGHFKLAEGKDVLTIFGYETKPKVFKKWEIHKDGNYKVYEGKDFLENGKGYWRQVE